MRGVRVSLAALAGLTCAGVAQGEAPVRVVAVWAEWCGACRILDPNLAAADARVPDETAVFARFDLSSVNSTIASFRDAERWNAVAAFEGAQGATGYALILDSRTGEVYGRLGAAFSPADMAAMIEQAAAKAAATRDGA